MASGIQVREGRTEDLEAAELLFDSASVAFGLLAGSPEGARAALRRLWALPGHSMSFEHALIAEIDGRIAGVVVGFPSRARLRLHLALLRQGARDIPLARRLLIPPAMAGLIAATPRPPRDAIYISAIAVSRPFFRRGVATTLFDAMATRAREAGFQKLAGHTGVRHAVMRATAERYGFRPTRAGRWGLVLYELDLGR